MQLAIFAISGGSVHKSGETRLSERKKYNSDSCQTSITIIG